MYPKLLVVYPPSSNQNSKLSDKEEAKATTKESVTETDVEDNDAFLFKANQLNNASSV